MIVFDTLSTSYFSFNLLCHFQNFALICTILNLRMAIVCLSAVITSFGTLDIHSALLTHVRMTLELIGTKYSNCCQSDVTKLSTHILLKYLQTE